MLRISRLKIVQILLEDERYLANLIFYESLKVKTVINQYDLRENIIETTAQQTAHKFNQKSLTEFA